MDNLPQIPLMLSAQLPEEKAVLRPAQDKREWLVVICANQPPL
jgi:hypothetical protein